MKLVHRLPYRRGALAAFLAAAALTVAACSSSGGTDPTGGSDPGQSAGQAPNTNPAASGAGPVSPREAQNKLVAVAVQDPGTLDYVKSNLTALSLWIPSIVEPLVYFDSAGKATPGVSDKWTISDDQKTYTFHIRDTSFSDGTPVTADDVVYSLNAMKGSPVTRNAVAYSAVTGITKVDAHTVKVTLSRPSRTFFDGMGNMAGLIQPKAAAAKIATDPIGTGPYKLVKYVPNDSITLTANTHYWGTKPAIPDVTIKIIPDQNAALNALKAGEADLFAPAGAQFWSQITKEGLDKKYHLVTYPQSGEPTYGVINSRVPVEVRQAIAKTFDRESIKALFDAPWGIKTTCTFGEPDRSWFKEYSTDSCPYPYDEKAAAADVAANGMASKEIEFTSLTDVGDLKPPAEVMIAEMQAAGFKVKNNAVDLARYSQIVFSAKDPDFDVTVMAGDDSPTNWACPDPSQVSWATYCSQKYTTLLDQADAAKSTAEYDKIMAEAMDTLTKDAVIVPLVSKSGVGLMDQHLQGWQDPNVFVGIRLASLHW
jgi:peptide/nickel transport system substrate-binding protein